MTDTRKNPNSILKIWFVSFIYEVPDPDFSYWKYTSEASLCQHHFILTGEFFLTPTSDLEN